MKKKKISFVFYVAMVSGAAFDAFSSSSSLSTQGGIAQEGTDGVDLHTGKQIECAPVEPFSEKLEQKQSEQANSPQKKRVYTMEELLKYKGIKTPPKGIEAALAIIKGERAPNQMVSQTEDTGDRINNAIAAAHPQLEEIEKRLTQGDSDLEKLEERIGDLPNEPSIQPSSQGSTQGSTQGSIEGSEPLSSDEETPVWLPPETHPPSSDVSAKREKEWRDDGYVTSSEY